MTKRRDMQLFRFLAGKPALLALSGLISVTATASEHGPTYLDPVTQTEIQLEELEILTSASQECDISFKLVYPDFTHPVSFASAKNTPKGLVMAGDRDFSFCRPGSGADELKCNVVFLSKGELQDFASVGISTMMLARFCSVMPDSVEFGAQNPCDPDGILTFPGQLATEVKNCAL